LQALRILLIPFSILYSVIIYFRNKLFDTGIFKSVRIPKPVISIGNITTGGTGKTPLTIFIAKYFLNKGKKVGIAARGYKRKSNDIEVVSDGININESIDQSGDELILISEELIKSFKGNFFVAAGSDRIAASEMMIRKFNPDIIILDDAFQHRKIRRDIDIVLVDGEDFSRNKFLNTFTLPSGKLREGFSNLGRADVIIQNNKASEMNLISKLKDFKKDIIVMRFKTEYIMDFKNSILQKADSNAIVFSGIANDESFIKMVKDSGMNIEEVLKFPDHHNYTEDDLSFLKQKFSGKEIFITTEKDFVKLKRSGDFVLKYPVYFLKMEIEPVENKNILINKLDKIIK
jgi:tetraacyldisaccharide 4'-kinase